MITRDEFESLLTTLKDKLDETTGALVSEDILNVLSNATIMFDKIDELTKSVENLTKDKEDLLKTNGQLFQKIGFEKEEVVEDKVEDLIEDVIELEDIIDEKGDFVNGD